MRWTEKEKKVKFERSKDNIHFDSTARIGLYLKWHCNLSFHLFLPVFFFFTWSTFIAIHAVFVRRAAHHFHLYIILKKINYSYFNLAPAYFAHSFGLVSRRYFLFIRCSISHLLLFLFFSSPLYHFLFISPRPVLVAQHDFCLLSYCAISVTYKLSPSMPTNLWFTFFFCCLPLPLLSLTNECMCLLSNEHFSCIHHCGTVEQFLVDIRQWFFFVCVLRIFCYCWTPRKSKRHSTFPGNFRQKSEPRCHR